MTGPRVVSDLDLDELVARGVLEPLDRALAMCIAELAGDEADPARAALVRLGAAVASNAVVRGHVCAPIADICATPPLDRDGTVVDALRWPDADVWAAALNDSPAVDPSGVNAPTPLVFERGRLYLRRYYELEREIAADLVARSARVEVIDAALLEEDIAGLFPDAEGRERRQADAARCAAEHRLALISGGPGTGKTRTVARVLAILVRQALAAGRRVPRVALVAPTGKAAQRLGEAIAANIDHGMLMPPEVLAALPVQAATIHRRLGSIPSAPTRFRHHRDNPLFADIVVVDEASMIDISLMARLLSAVPRGAHLILLGDRDQLASVEAGAIYGDLCLSAESPSSVVRAGSVHLTESFRTDAGGAIAGAAAAVRSGDALALGAIVAAAGDALSWVRPGAGADPVAAIAEHVVEGFRAYLCASEPAEALAALASFRVLCAHRRGRHGATRVGEAVARLLQARGMIDRVPGDDWYAWRPVIVTQNDYQLELFNGDVGVTLPEPGPDGRTRLRVWFPPSSAGGAPRAFQPSRLPAVETCFAMTVHKSQGSEFRSVAVVLPEEPSAICTRELLYTGLTRARDRAILVSGADVVRAAVASRIRRWSGLAARLDARAPGAPQ